MGLGAILRQAGFFHARKQGNGQCKEKKHRRTDCPIILLVPHVVDRTPRPAHNHRAHCEQAHEVQRGGRREVMHRRGHGNSPSYSQLHITCQLKAQGVATRCRHARSKPTSRPIKQNRPNRLVYPYQMQVGFCPLSPFRHYLIQQRRRSGGSRCWRRLDEL